MPPVAAVIEKGRIIGRVFCLSMMNILFFYIIFHILTRYTANKTRSGMMSQLVFYSRACRVCSFSPFHLAKPILPAIILFNFVAHKQPDAFRRDAGKMVERLPSGMATLQSG